MEEKDLVSVVIPVYNVSDYLEECLESVIKQTYRNIEIIAINDGSTDNSIEILNKYKNIDKRINVFNQSNQGLGTTRNNAIEKCKGKFIVFLDSDDYLKKNCIDILMKNQKQYNAEIVIFNARGFYEEDNNKVYDEKKYFNIDNKYMNVSLDGKKTSEFAIECVSSCLKMYKSSFIKNNSIFFTTIGVGEDVAFWYKCCAKSKNIMITDYVGYYRRYRPGSIMQTENAKAIKERILTLASIKEYFDSIREEDENKFIRDGIANYCYGLYIKSLKTEEHEKNDLLNKLSEVNAKEIFLDYSINKRKKNLRMIMYKFPDICVKLWKVKKAIKKLYIKN